MPISAFVLTMFGGIWLCLWTQAWRFAGIAMMAVGLVMAALAEGPDILVSDDGRLMAVRDGEGALMVSSKRYARRARDTWLRRNGLDGAETWAQHQDRGGGVIRCDELSCIYQSPSWSGHKVALVTSPLALAEDCHQAELVISAVPARGCRPAYGVIDRFDLWRYGTHALWLSRDGPYIETVADHQGNRPWARYPGEHAFDKARSNR